MGKGAVIMPAEPREVSWTTMSTLGNGETTTVNVFLRMSRRPRVGAAVTAVILILRTKV